MLCAACCDGCRATCARWMLGHYRDVNELMLSAQHVAGWFFSGVPMSERQLMHSAHPQAGHAAQGQGASQSPAAKSPVALARVPTPPPLFTIIAAFEPTATRPAATALHERNTSNGFPAPVGSARYAFRHPQKNFT